MATSATTDISAVNLPDTGAAPKSEYDVSELMKQSEYDSLPSRPEPAKTPAETPVAKPAETPAPTPKEFDHPRTLVRRAVALGASMADIRATPTDRLDEWIDANETAAAQNAKSVESNDSTEKADPYGIEALVKENPDYDTPVLKVLRKVAEKSNASEARLAAIENENKSLKSQLAKQSQAKQIDTIDEVFVGLNNPKMFGNGGRAALDANSAEAKRRLSVLASAGIKKGDSDAVVKAKVKETAELLYGVGGAAEPAGGSLNVTQTNGHARITPEQWEKSGLNAPTSRQAVEPEGVNKAYKAVQEMMVQKGMYADDDESAASLRVPKS